jgi:hypothetical protein
MAEQLFCKQLVGGSIPFAGSKFDEELRQAGEQVHVAEDRVQAGAKH